MFGKRRFSALAAVVALAVIAGALGGAMATVGLQQFAGNAPAPAVNAAANGAFDATVARIDADIAALKASVEHTSKLGLAQFNKTNDRLDKVEKAQLEPAAKLAKLGEAVEKLPCRRPRLLRSLPLRPRRPRPKEVTGSITPPRRRPRPRQSRRQAEVGRLPTVDGWMLARRRRWRRADRGPPRHLRSLCRRSGAGPRPRRCDPPSGWPLGRGHQPRPDRRALAASIGTAPVAIWKAPHGHVRRIPHFGSSQDVGQLLD